MRRLPERPNLEHLRHQARDLLHSARVGDPVPSAEIASVSSRITLSSAQLAIARSYGFPSWPRLKAEVERREILNNRDLKRLEELLTERPEFATERLRRWCDYDGVGPVGYLAMLRFNAGRLGLPVDLPRTGEAAKLLLEAGAPLEGYPRTRKPRSSPLRLRGR